MRTVRDLVNAEAPVLENTRTCSAWDPFGNRTEVEVSVTGLQSRCFLLMYTHHVADLGVPVAGRIRTVSTPLRTEVVSEAGALGGLTVKVVLTGRLCNPAGETATMVNITTPPTAARPSPRQSGSAPRWYT